jgi:hypothetical protein
MMAIETRAANTTVASATDHAGTPRSIASFWKNGDSPNASTVIVALTTTRRPLPLSLMSRLPPVGQRSAPQRIRRNRRQLRARRQRHPVDASLRPGALHHDAHPETGNISESD